MSFNLDAICDQLPQINFSLDLRLGGLQNTSLHLIVNYNNVLFLKPWIQDGKRSQIFPLLGFLHCSAIAEICTVLFWTVEGAIDSLDKPKSHRRD